MNNYKSKFWRNFLGCTSFSLLLLVPTSYFAHDPTMSAAGRVFFAVLFSIGTGLFAAGNIEGETYISDVSYHNKNLEQDERNDS